MSTRERFWPRRLRWRLSGAWQWPAFAALTFGDGIILHLLPPFRAGVRLIPALIVATFANLLLVGVVAPWLSRRLVKREQHLPPEVVFDRTATALLVAGTVGLLFAGYSARDNTVLETQAREENARVVREYVAAHGDEEVRRNADGANTARLSEEGLFRNCVPRDDRSRAFCIFVDTKPEPPMIREDPSQLPNGRGGAGEATRP